MILLFEFLKPAITVDLEMTFRVPNGCREKSSLVSNDGIGQGQSLSLMVPCPVRKRSFDVREFAFRSLDRRPTAIVREKILVLLP